MSKETKFTGAEWVINADPKSYLITTESGFGICETPLNEDCDKHNAHLIKTAPKLYAMLDTLIARGVELMSIDEIDDEEDAATVHSDFNDSVILAIKLLAEARGE